MSKVLWEQYEGWKKGCKIVDLSHPFSPDTPHWSGFPDMKVEIPFNYPDGFYVNKFEVVSQYGTHVDAPCHFIEGARGLDEVRADEMILPLCVLDVRDKVAANDDYVVTVQDILDWEEKNGKLPEGCFLACCSDWSKREDMNNYDADGNKHYPGWGIDTLKFLVEERNVAAIGHEPSDTDAPIVSDKEGLIGETYILGQDRYQIELMCNLSELPATGSLIFCGFPKAVGAAGFSARCIAICPNE